jgi:hypothetical protein
MDDHFIVTAFVIIDDLMTKFDHHTHCLAKVSDAEVITIAVIAAKFFNNNHQNALGAMKAARYIPNELNPSRFNRRIHHLRDWLEFALETIGELCRHGDVYSIDSMPLPVCQRVKAYDARKFGGRNTADIVQRKNRNSLVAVPPVRCVLGPRRRLHLICDEAGMPVTFTILAAGFHDLTPIHELTYELPEEAVLYGDKAFNAAMDEASILEEVGVLVVPIRRKNMKVQNSIGEMFGLAKFRHRVESDHARQRSRPSGASWDQEGAFYGQER